MTKGGQVIWGLMVAPLSPKVANLGQGLSQKAGFFLIFEPLLQADFLTKYWLFQTRNLLLYLFLAFLAVAFSQFCSNVILKDAFS